MSDSPADKLQHALSALHETRRAVEALPLGSSGRLTKLTVLQRLLEAEIGLLRGLTYRTAGVRVRDVFGANVRKERIRQGLSQQRLAELAGMDHSFIGHIEQFRKGVTLDTVDKVAEILDVPPPDLLR